MKQNSCLVSGYPRMTINLALGTGTRSIITSGSLGYRTSCLIVFSPLFNRYYRCYENKVFQEEKLIAGYLIIASETQIKLLDSLNLGQN